MTRWIDRLDRRFGFIAVPDLAGFLAGMNAAVGILTLFRPEFPSQLLLDPALIRQGEVWRIITYIFVPPSIAPLWMFLWLILYYSYLRMLENAWGDFKLTFFCLIGALSTALAALALGLELGNAAFSTSLFLAFARLNPEFEILLFFFLPVRMKWLAALTWAMLGYRLAAGGFAARMDVLAGLLNYLLFFGPEHKAELSLLWRRWRRRGRF